MHAIDAHNYTARRRDQYRAEPLTEDELKRTVPSAFAASAHESRSARYAYIPTIEVLRGLQRHGFEPFRAVQARARVEDKRGYTKHMITMRHADSIARVQRTYDTDINEVIVLNSHDGGSCFQLFAGCFRFACTNGLICNIRSLEDIRVKHSGNARDEVIEGAFAILQSFETVDASKEAFKVMQLSPGEQRAYATAALAYRYPRDDENPAPPPISADQLLKSRRHSDEGDSLWLTFNRVQENAVRGGLPGEHRDSEGRRRRRQTRAVNGIDRNVQLNRALWVLAEELRKSR